MPARVPSHRSDDFSRGFGVLLFKNRSIGAALGLFVLLCGLLWLILCVAGVVALHTRHELAAVAVRGWAWLLLEILRHDLGRWPVWTTAGWEKWPPSAILAEPWFATTAGEVVRTLGWSALAATSTVAPVALMSHRWIKSFGARMLTGTYLRGAVRTSDAELARRVRKRRQAGHLAIGRVPLPATTECEHLAFIGAPGTGKTLAILGLLDAIRARGDAVVIYDSKGVFTGFYFDAARGDVLLNPLDARTRPWSPWAEIEDAMDADRLACALIPPGDHKEPFFHDSARAMFSAALTKMLQTGDRSVERLLHLVLHALDDERERFYAGTEAAQWAS